MVSTISRECDLSQTGKIPGLDLIRTLTTRGEFKKGKGELKKTSGRSTAKG